MSTVNITTTNNTVSIQDTNQTIAVIDNNKNTTVYIPQTNTNIVEVNTPGPQGPVGPPGPPGIGSLSASYAISSSYALTASYAMNGGGGNAFPYTGSAEITGSLIVSGSLNVTQGITGSLFGTASFATQALSSSYAVNALTASYASNGGVTQLLAGPNVTLSPTNGLGQVTISSTGGGGLSFNTATGSYGSFYSTVTQTNVAGTARSMSLNTTDITNGVLISGSTNPFNTYIKTENAGVYNIQFSAQVDKTDSGTDEIWIWLRKNGTDLTDTATSLQLVGNGAHYVAAWNFFVNAAANDYYQLMWYSPDANTRLHAEPAFGVVPGIPSLIVTVNRIDQFLSNTGSFTGSFTGAFSGSLFGTASFASTASFAQNSLTASYVTTLNQDLIVSEGYKIYINSPVTPSAGISSYLDPISQLTNIGDYSGETIRGFAGSQLLPGELIYLYTDGLWYKADASPDITNGDRSATSLLGILVGSAVAELNDSIVVLLQGIVYTNAVSGTPDVGIPLWISDGSPGRMILSEPGSTNNVVRQVGRTITSNVIRFAPDNYFSIVT